MIVDAQPALWYNYYAMVVRNKLGTSSREYFSSVSPKGQITLPAEVRRLLGVNPRDKVAIVMRGETITVEKRVADLRSAYMVFPALKKKLSDGETTDIARDEHLQHVAQEGL